MHRVLCAFAASSQLRYGRLEAANAHKTQHCVLIGAGPNLCSVYRCAAHSAAALCYSLHALLADLQVSMHCVLCAFAASSPLLCGRLEAANAHKLGVVVELANCQASAGERALPARRHQPLGNCGLLWSRHI